MNKLLQIKNSIAILLILVILISIVRSAKAQENRVASGRNVQTATSQPQGPTDPAELEAFLDDLFGRQMRDYHIAGAAISVVKDGKLFFLRRPSGYSDQCHPHAQQAQS